MDAVTPVFRNRNEIARSLALVMLMIVMDMSGLAGLAAQDELDERQEARSTLSNLNIPGFQKGIANSSVTFDIGEEGGHACAILSDGAIYCWGNGGSYRLGTGNTSDSFVPVPIDTTHTSGLTAVSLSLGGSHQCALFSDSNVYCWGNAYPAGGSQVGYTIQYPNPVQTSLTSEHYGLGYGNAVMVESGATHSCAILDNGTVQCWGNNYHGQLGVGYKCTSSDIGDCNNQGSDTYLEHPHYVNLPIGSVAVGLNLWGENTCIIIEGGDYYCMGNFFNSPHPTEKSQSHQIVAAESHSAITSDGEYIELYSLGWDDECVQIYTRDPTNTTATHTCENANYRVFSGSHNEGANDDWDHDNMFIMHNGSVGIGIIWEYADSSHGVPGVSTTHGGYLTRAWIEVPAGLNASAVASEANQLACVAYDNGSLQCWGYNSQGQVGDGTICNEGSTDGYGNLTGCTDSNYAFYPRWVQFPTGLHLTLDEMDDDGDGIVDITDKCPSGGATGWTSTPSTDYDSDGCRDSDEDTDDDGDGYEDSVDTHPTNEMFHHTLTMNDGWIVGGRYENVSASYGSVSADMIAESQSSSFRAQSNEYSYRITVDGQLAYNDGSLVSVNWDTTDQIIAITPTRYNGAGCVILESGALRCWGGNWQGQVGAGTTVSYYDGPSESANVSFPVPFAPKHITTGFYTSCAVLENGEAYCWGYNTGTSSLGVGFNCESSSWLNGCDGNGHIREPTLPVILPAGSSAESVYIGQNYGSPTCVVLTDGNVYCMGENN
ncbi:hypothetical protein OAI65_01790, partial [Candidatus Poseidoniales archaeon]|nr:hypothetical protein [Candidatus Poseidoniales archaeon]